MPARRPEDGPEIVEKRNDFLAAGRKEGEAIKRQAEEHARQLVSEHDIVVEARRKSAEIVANADRKSRELRRVTSEYCEELLKSTEESVSSTLEDVKKARAKFPQPAQIKYRKIAKIWQRRTPPGALLCFFMRRFS